MSIPGKSARPVGAYRVGLLLDRPRNALERGLGHASSLLRNFVAVPQEQLIGHGRLLLAVTALAALSLNHSQPGQSQATARIVLVAYVLFAVAVLFVSFRTLVPSVAQVAIHLIDLATISMLLLTTRGPTSPFFVFFSFALLAATLRWEWRGAVWTGSFVVLFLLAWLAAQGVPSGGTVDFDRLVARISYIFVASALFAYFGAFRERSRRRLEALAGWPVTSPGENWQQSFGEALSRAAALTDAERLVVVWQQLDDLNSLYADWNAGTLRTGSLPPPHSDARHLGASNKSPA